MKNRKHFLYILCCLCFLTGLFAISAQDKVVENLPREIRRIPNNFKEEYKGSDYNYVESISWVDKMKAWMLDKLDSWFGVQSKRGSNILKNLETIFYILVILGVVYLLLKMILNKEGRWLFGRKKEETNELNYEIGENIHEVDFDVLINEALQNKDYRLAVRYNYLQLLKKLDQFNIIEYDSQKTTYDYSVALEGTAYSPGFNKATYYYTYIWYGEFSIDEEEYKTASTVYAQTLKSFKNA